jgi:sucrose phosphorylase
MATTRETEARMQAHLEFLYPGRGAEVLQQLQALIGRTRVPRRAGGWTEKDAMLITYGDQISNPASGEAPLQTLHRFARRHLAGAFSSVHILPFYPYTSDDGFSVVDFKQVKPEWGTWQDIQALSHDFRLMIDLVCNHVSASSAWFQGFLRDDPKFKDYFTTVKPGIDLSQVFRPRALPLLTPFHTPSGEKLVWTTFSTDQVDLNFANPAVLLEVIDALLHYAANGASYIRLDAVGFIWKVIGTSCMHLEGAHRIVKLMRLVMNAAAPHVALITETNVPHKDNISYFGSGDDEAQMVYQFPLPPLVLHTLRTGDATKLANWARELAPPSADTSFFNFLASHDGIGVVPANGILDPPDIAAIVQQVLDHGGKVNHKDTPHGPVPYELCVTLFDALNRPNSREPASLQIDRFIAANAILLSLQGVPGVYVHSLFGSPSDHAGLASSGINRRLNRHKFSQAELDTQLGDAGSRAARVLACYTHLLRVRASHAAFHPNAGQEILPSRSVLHIVRGGSVHCLINVSAQAQQAGPRGRDLISGKPHGGTLAPYQVAWVEPS